MASGPVDLAEAYAYPAEGAWLRANMISTLDGAAWSLEGRSGGLGNEADRQLFSLMRGLADVVIAGAGTARVEGYGPVAPGPGWEELRAGRTAVPPLAIVSRRLELDLGGPLFTDADPPTILLTVEDAPADRLQLAQEVADVIIAGEHAVDFAMAVKQLEARGHRRLLCEGGPHVLAQMVEAGVLDELCLTLSPMMLSGMASRILNGTTLAAPSNMKLGQVLEEEGYLFMRYCKT
ncbi:pyrimidine reductase family protein [Actinomadura rudentiformis]|uniref:pyrimidine reductase family protein n=1 Tax=Actinomadura rudentiformis TaxID=359158 RepID=UPI001CEF6AAC|nr:pyrimidine reductase family protein [Actinomadura rudentiformis]